VARAYEQEMRLGLVLLVAALLPGCNVNFVRKSAEPESLKQRIEYFKWLHEKGFSRSDPEMMKRAAAKLLEVREREETPAQSEALERLLRRLDEELDRLARERR
jgi:hypothetical protein